MHTTSKRNPSSGFKRSGCALALLGALAGCGGDASTLIGAAVVTSSTTQAVPLADPAGQGVSPAMPMPAALPDAAATVRQPGAGVR